MEDKKYDNEPIPATRYDYFYLDAHGDLHGLLPLTPGDAIGFGESCSTLTPLVNFFSEEKPQYFEKELNRYLTDLNKLSDEKIDFQKKKTQRQLEAYREILTKIAKEFKGRLNGASWPQVISQLLSNEKQPKNNLISISLRPQRPDSKNVTIRVKSNKTQENDTSEEHYALCSFYREGTGFVPDLQEKLGELKKNTILDRHPKKKNLQEKFIEEVEKKFREFKKDDSSLENKATIADEADFIKLKEAMRYVAARTFFPEQELAQAMEQAESLLSNAFPIKSTSINTVVEESRKIDLAYLREKGLYEAEKNIPLNEAIRYWIGAAIKPTAFAQKIDDPFSEIENNAEDEREFISVRVQFFLAMINAYYCSTTGNRSNFGKILDNDPKLPVMLVATISYAIEQQCDIADYIFRFFNYEDNYKKFNIGGPISFEQKSDIKALFSDQFNSIKGRDRPYDEFIILLDCEGSAFSWNFKISMHLAEIIKKIDPECHKKYFESSVPGTPPILSSTIVLPEEKCRTRNRHVLEPISTISLTPHNSASFKGVSNSGFCREFWKNSARRKKLILGGLEFCLLSISVLTLAESALNYTRQKTMTSVMERCPDSVLIAILVITSVLATFAAIAAGKGVQDAIRGNDLVDNRL